MGNNKGDRKTERKDKVQLAPEQVSRMLRAYQSDERPSVEDLCKRFRITGARFREYREAAGVPERIKPPVMTPQALSNRRRRAAIIAARGAGAVGQ